ncbi:MAG: ATP-dependent DNA ligase [Thermoplasmata archaeon]
MLFAELVRTYEELQRTSRRTESREHLAALLRSVPPGEIASVVYLTQGTVRPAYEGVELGVAGSLARRAVALATGADETTVGARLRELGDLGSTVQELLASGSPPAPSVPLSVRDVHGGLLAIARLSGVGSQERKVSAVLELLARSTPTEAKYVIRFVLDELRLGVRDQTILDALNFAFAAGDKDSRKRIEGAYNLSSDLGDVAERLAEHGVPGLDAIVISAGRPIRPMLAEREPSLEAVLKRMDGRAALEYKYDGLRVQAHLASDGSVRLFSRRLEEIGAQFPDVVASLPASVAERPTIVEGECVSIDPDTDEIRPFQEVSRRRGRKHNLEQAQKEVPVCLFLFDVLLAGGTPVFERSFPERREILERIVRPSSGVRLAVQRVVDSVPDAQAFFDEGVESGAEGIMAKSLSPDSAYRAGARGFWWIKYKREYATGLDDSIDGVVVGGFHGRGRRAGRFGAYLLAAYDPQRDRFETFTKVGTGFDDEALAEMARRTEPLVVPDKPDSVDTGLTADTWFRPSLVLEVRGAELSLSPTHRAGEGRIRPGVGFALRFPRFTGRYRDDKGASEATTVDELVTMYRAQVRRVDEEEPKSGVSDG